MVKVELNRLLREGYFYIFLSFSDGQGSLGYARDVPLPGNVVSVTNEAFYRANYRCRRRAYEQWHRVQSKQHILRSQVGFQDTTSSRPKACVGCSNYHGIAYGTTRAHRTPLICAMHPYGWHDSSGCPDWLGEEP